MVFRPSLPPAIWRITRMVESFPVAVRMPLSAASACSWANVCARNDGTVQVKAEPSAAVRKKSRRVFSVITLRELKFRGAHDQPDRFKDTVRIEFPLRVRIILQPLRIF